MKTENENLMVSSVDELDERLYPSNPKGIYRQFNQDPVERAREMNSLAKEAADFRNLGMKVQAEEKETQIATLAATGKTPR